MSKSVAPHPPTSSPVNAIFLQVLKKLESHDLGTRSAPNTTSGPLYSEWQSANHCFDLPDLSALVRLSSVLPDSLDQVAYTFFKPAALTIVEVPDEHLLASCEQVLERGFLAAVRSEYDYLPAIRMISNGEQSLGSLRSRYSKRNTNGLPSSLASQTPTVLLVQDRHSLPASVWSASSATYTLPALGCDEINVLFRLIHGISLQAVLPDLLTKLPSNQDLGRLPLEEVYACLRKPTAAVVAASFWSAVEAKQVEEEQSALDQVIGLGPARAQLEQIAEDLVNWKNGQLAWEDVTRGVLLYGDPGTGKTFCARQLAKQCGAHFVPTSYAEWQRHGHLGDLLAAMTKSFKEARENAPSILFLDEIDAFGDRQTASGDNAQYTRTVINALLEQLDGAGKQEGVLVMAACNFPELLDEALVRSGRFDLKISMPLPDKTALVELLHLHLGNVSGGPSLTQLAQRLVGSSGADVAALVRKARGHARQHKRVFSIADLEDVVAAFAPSFSEQDLRRAALHEAGHAVVGYYSGKGKPLWARIGNNGGEVSFTAANPLPDIVGLEAEIATALAGRASEEVFYGAPCAGAGGSDDSDLAKATKLAVSIETIYGLGDSGLTWRPSSNDTLAVLLANHDLATRVETRLKAALDVAKSIVIKHRAMVETIAEKLVARRELSSGELFDLLSPCEQQRLSDVNHDPVLEEKRAPDCPEVRV